MIENRSALLGSHYEHEIKGFRNDQDKKHKGLGVVAIEALI